MARRVIVFAIFVVMMVFAVSTSLLASEAGENDDADFIRWIDFDIPLSVLNQAYKYDTESQDSEFPLDFVQLLAYAASKNWGNFEKNEKSEAMDDVVNRIRSGENLHEIVDGMKLYEFYFEAYRAVLGGFVGSYTIKTDDKEGFPEKHYGLKVFSPIAKGYHFTHSDDFGNPRSYGYRRPHLGHDLFGNEGTPIIAVEDGVVEALGWNQYGGWRIGIRSIDGKRYYYYAHLRKDRPYAAGLETGKNVCAGDVIGYLGATGYSVKENVCNIKVPHLHFGMQIIFDESQKDGKNQIWIDAYNIVRFLSKNRMEVLRDDKGEYIRAITIDNMPSE